ncbi:hypothetical protein IMSAGC020_02178 [Lachnospiraceae bacterium]|nr:hypothetical protein IMSAGC020_02178 [Lachnospiraceae bacterium]
MADTEKDLNNLLKILHGRKTLTVPQKFIL